MNLFANNGGNKYLVNNKSLSQYFVIYPLLAMTEVKRCFGAVAGQHGLSTPSKDFLWG